MNLLPLLGVTLFALFLGNSAFAGPYRDCMKAEMKKSLDSMACDFSRLNFARSSATNKCGPKALEELLSYPAAQVGTDEFNSKLDNLRRAGNGDIDELANQKADKCGVSLTIKGDTVTTKAKTVR